MEEEQRLHYKDVVNIEYVISQDEIMWAIKDDEWQAFRRSLKGLSTVQKLRKLHWWLSQSLFDFDKDHRKRQVQVMNYINALKRGGQLDRDGYIQR